MCLSPPATAAPHRGGHSDPHTGLYDAPRGPPRRPVTAAG